MIRLFAIIYLNALALDGAKNNSDEILHVMSLASS